jgi:hypothetical protein
MGVGWSFHFSLVCHDLALQMYILHSHIGSLRYPALSKKMNYWHGVIYNTSGIVFNCSNATVDSTLPYYLLLIRYVGANTAVAGYSSRFMAPF